MSNANAGQLSPFDLPSSMSCQGGFEGFAPVILTSLRSSIFQLLGVKHEIASSLKALSHDPRLWESVVTFAKNLYNEIHAPNQHKISFYYRQRAVAWVQTAGFALLRVSGNTLYGDS